MALASLVSNLRQLLFLPMANASLCAQTGCSRVVIAALLATASAQRATVSTNARLAMRTSLKCSWMVDASQAAPSTLGE